MNPKYFICPMSKNIVDALIELNSENFGIIATRRQIDFDGGYVNNWDTKTFHDYIKSKIKTILKRDHGGPGQGKVDDDGMESLKYDSQYFDVVHLDPWKKYNQSWSEGAKKTLDIINVLYEINPNLKYEICTEEAIIYLSTSDIENILKYLKNNLSEGAFANIEYVVIQSGVGLDLMSMKNTGKFSQSRLKEMIELVNSFGKKTKEHNGDYLNYDELKLRFDTGLTSLNIGPEIAQIETLTYLEYMDNEQIDDFYKICLDSKKWERWVTKDFDINDKKTLIQVCGHYCYNSYNLPQINDIIKSKIKDKLKKLPQ